MTKSSTEPKFIKMLTRPEGATSEELRQAMNRIWAPTIAQLRPIAARLDYALMYSKEQGERMRYYFTATKAPAKAAAAGVKRAPKKTVKGTPEQEALLERARATRRAKAAAKRSC